MKRLALLLLCGLAGCSLQTSAPILALAGQASAGVKPATRLKCTLLWDWPENMNGVRGFRIYHTNTLNVSESWSIGLRTNFDVTILQAATPQVDAYWVCSRMATNDSPPSNIATYPPPPTVSSPTFLILSWPAPSATVWVSSNLATWQVLTNVTGTNLAVPLGSPPRFYRISSDRPTLINWHTQ